MMHEVPRDLLPEVLKCNLCKLRQKDVNPGQVSVAFSDLVTHTQYCTKTFERRLEDVSGARLVTVVIGVIGRLSQVQAYQKRDSLI